MWTYTIRSLLERRSTIAPTALAIAVSIAAATTMLCVVNGLLSSLSRSRAPSNVVVLSEGAMDEFQSDIEAPLVNELRVAHEVAGGEPGLLSAELVIAVDMKTSAGHLERVTARGASAAAYRVHPRIHVLRGNPPGSSEPGLLVGVKRLGTLKGLVEGGKVRIGREIWPVLGVFEAPDTIFESELWCDRAALQTAMHRSGPTVAYAKLPADRQPAFGAAVAKITTARLEALSEPAYFARTSGQVSIYVRAVVFIIVLLSLGAVIASVNAMYSSFLSRAVELATLMTIGFNRFRIARMVLAESILMATMSGLFGALVGFAIHGRTMSFGQMALVYRAELSPAIFAGAIGLSMLIGLCAGFAGAVQMLRMNLLAALSGR